MDNSIDFEEFLDGEISDEDLETIAELARKQVQLEDWIAKGEEKIKEAKKHLAKIQNDLLPAALLDKGLTGFTLPDGSAVEIKEGLKANIAKKNEVWCFEWLEENGHGSIIKDEFKLVYQPDEKEQAEALAEYLQENDVVNYNRRRFVHHSTLPAFVRVELEENEHTEEWEQRFGVFRYKQSNISRPDK